jgi:WD40 repeat protein
VVKDGKKKFMPPGKREKLSENEIGLIARWIDGGAQPPLAGPEKPREIKVPKVAPKVVPRNAITALAYSAAANVIAVGRLGVVELLDPMTRAVVRQFAGHAGNVNALAFSADGKSIFAASGENGLFGEVKQWQISDGQLVRTIRGHRDTLYALAISPDGALLATGSYDQQIKLWSAQTGEERKTLRGHNGAVFALAFRPDGQILASASADRTVKLWDVATGQRRDTLSQPTKEQVTVAWSKDGKRIAAAGFDNRIRVWEVSAEAKETTNPLRIARFAHEQPILRIAWSEDGQTVASAAQDATVKLWDAREMKERLLLERQTDWPSALAFAGNTTLVAGRLDGSLACYDVQSGASKVAAAPAKPAPAAKPAKPQISALAPRGVQRGVASQIRVKGKEFSQVHGARLEIPPGATKETAAAHSVPAELLPERSDTELIIRVTAPADLQRGTFDLNLLDAENKVVGATKIVVDDLPQIDGIEKVVERVAQFPASVWGVLKVPGENDRLEFHVQAGQTIVFDLAGKALGSKVDAVLNLTDRSGRVLASNNDFDTSGDPLIAHTFPAEGDFAVVVTDLQSNGSPDHFYRLSMGELPFVTACFPPCIPAHKDAEVELVGFNLGKAPTVGVKAAPAGEIELPLDRDKLRARRVFKLVVSDQPVTIEREPNNVLAAATPFSVPGSVAGRFVQAPGAPSELPEAAAPGAALVSAKASLVVPGQSAMARGIDVDLFAFEAKRDSRWVIETEAARRGSPADTKIEVLQPDGTPVDRVVLQAMRDSAITFRPIDSATNDVRVENWREMELNELLYMNGEVAKIFRMPEGPDSGFQFYTINGKRQAYYDTTATAHALDEACYIVKPLPPGSPIIANGLPAFHVAYANDDDGERRLGIDSHILFTAPADGKYLVRVTDSRGMQSARHIYRLIVREAKPDFGVSVALGDATINAGSGQSFTINVDRKDGFDGDVRIDITGAPDGFKVATPLVVQAGHQSAKGTVFALPGAATAPKAAWANVKVSAAATIAGEKIERTAAGFVGVKVGAAPKLYVALEPVAPGDTLEHLSKPTPIQEQDPDKPFEITIAPGEIVPAWIKVKRNGESGDLRFDVENLPHGVIVDNLGLNGITLLANANEGEIALKAARWVEEMDRLCFAVSRGAGAQTSLPVMLHVRKKEAVKVVEVK